MHGGAWIGIALGTSWSEIQRNTNVDHELLTRIFIKHLQGAHKDWIKHFTLLYFSTQVIKSMKSNDVL